MTRIDLYVCCGLVVLAALVLTIGLCRAASRDPGGHQ